MLRKKLALTKQGYRDLLRGIFFCALGNFVLMAPIMVLFALVNDFVDHLIAPSAPLPDLFFYLALVLIVLILMFVTQLLQYAFTYNVVYGESARKRIEIAEKLRKLPLSFFGRRDLSDLTTTIMKDVSDQERLYSHVMPQLFGSAISLFIIALGLFLYNWHLALAAFWVLPVALLIVLGSARYQQKMAGMQNERGLALADGIQEFLECGREIRATNQQERFLSTLDDKVDAFERAQYRAELGAGVCVTSAQGFLKLGIATTMLLSAALLGTGSISFMVFFGFMLVVARVYDPISIVMLSIAELLNMRLSLKRMIAIEEEPEQLGSYNFEPKGYDLTFDSVSFSYRDGEQVLHDVSFTAQAGEVTALVGPSGSGKSTVVKLAARFWDASKGRVSVGGVDVSTVDPETLLSDYAEVFQEVILFDDTVMNNIRLGKLSASDEEVLASARAANCDEFVQRLPQGYETMIGENGSQLSGGERQRISIARALLKDAPIVLLDEATASLDVENETEVQQALSRLLAEKTVLVIAHRMRTVANADKIVVLDKGAVVEAGTPQELMKLQGGLYRRMVEHQTKAAAWQV